MPSRPIDAVLFDVDDTLCEYRRDVPELLAASFEEVGVDPFFAAEDYFGRYDRFVDDSDDMYDLRERCFADLAREAGRDPELGEALADAYADERDHGNVRPLDGAVEAVERLRETHRVGVVTNGAPEMQREKLAALGLADAFETVVYGGYDAPAKPAPDPFHAALADLDVPPERAVHVGNSLRSDVPGAQAAGVAAAWLGTDPDPEPAPEYRIDSMRALHDPPW